MRSDTVALTPKQPPRAELLGKVLGERYKLVRVLGSGAMGDVYLAEHVVLGKKLAVKVLKQALSQDQELVTRFEQEAIAATRIGHENIVDVSDFGRTEDGSLYSVMELLDGENLGETLARRGPLPLAEALPLMLQVCRALTAAHACGIVHRDLKLDNLMVVRRDDGTPLVKVLDFGISKVSANEPGEAKKVTQLGMVLGTPNYMAPEQVRGEPVDHRADIYALGVATYEVATGSVPFGGPNITAVLMAHLSEPLQAPSQRRPDLGLPQAFDEFIAKALQKDREQRFQSMSEVRDGLVRCLEALGIAPALTPSTPMAAVTVGPGASAPMVSSAPGARAATPLPAEPLPAAPAPMADTYKPTTDPASLRAIVDGAKAQRRQTQGKQRRRTGMLALLLGVPLLLLAAGVGYLALRGRLGGPARPPTVVAQPQPPVEPPPDAVKAPPTTATLQPPVDPPPDTLKTPPPTMAPQPPVEPPPDAARTPPRPAPVPQRLSLKDVGRVFGAGQPRLRQCLDQNRSKLPAAAGKLLLKIVVADSGAVTEAKVTSQLDPVIADCVEARLKQLRFPKHREATQEFNIPLDYAFRD